MNLRIICMAGIITILPSLAIAATGMNKTGGNEATKAYMQSMQNMDKEMKSMSPTDNPNMDFVMMMKPHHQAAIDMAQTYLKYGTDPKLKSMAKNIITSQKKEIKDMNAWEAKHGM